ncbi:MAG: molybdopterin-guanine dinucleotide biosynthesis protein B, partial [Desulfotignum sp.]
MTPPIISIAGKSNSGKTTFAVKLISELTRRGYRIGSVKHTHHDIDMDRKGKDSWRHKQAGAEATLLITDQQIAMIKDREEVLDWIARLPNSYRGMAERLHGLILDSVPELSPRLWYGMPGYAK